MMNRKSTSLLVLFAGAACLPVLTGAAEPAPAPAVVNVTQADYNAAVGKINSTFNNKLKNAFEAYLKYFDKTPGLADNMRMDLHRRILSSAFPVDQDAYARQLARFAAEPDSTLKSSTLNTLIRDFAKANAAQLAEAEKLYAQQASNLTPQLRITALVELAGNRVRHSNDIVKFKAFFEAAKLLTDPNAKDAPAVSAFEKVKSDSLVSMIAVLMAYDLDEAQKLIAANAARFGAAQQMTLAKSLMLSALDNMDRPAFDAARAAFEALPDPVAKLPHYGDIARALGRDDPEAAEMMLRDALKRTGYDDAQRHELLAQLRGLNRPNAFTYGFYTPGAYEKYKALANEDLAVVERALASGALKRDRGLAGQFHDIAATAADFGDYPFAEAMLAQARSSHPTDYAFVPLALRLALRSNNLDVVRSVINPILANEKETLANTTFLKAVLFIFQRKDFKLFDAEVYGDQRFTSPERMILIRRASEMLFRGGRYEQSRLAHEEVIQNMFTPVEFKAYTVKGMANAPKTADAWARSPCYNQWDQMETRFVPYGDGYDMGNSTDISRNLKDAVKPTIPAEYRTGVQIAYDETGLHIYVRCDDPAVGEIVLGKRSGDGLEFLFRPGKDAAYHSWYFNAPPADNDEPHLVNWASPSPRYRLTYDNFQKDSAATPEAVVAHTFIPWLAFYDNLPIDGKVWTFGMQRWGRHSATLNGSVHELERALKLQFAFSPAELTALKRTVAVMSFNRYNKIRQNPGEFIQTWNDKVLGDPDFYRAELAALINELDNAGKRLTEPAPDGEIGAIFEKHVPLWAEIRYVVADRRNTYLKRQLLK